MSADDFVPRVQAIGDVLVAIVQGGRRYDALDRGLDSIVRILDALEAGYDEDSDGFIDSVMPQKFRDLAERNVEEVQFRVWLAPDIILAGYSVPLEQLARVHAAALGQSDEQAAEKAAHRLSDAVEGLLSKPGKDVLLRIALTRVVRQASSAIQEGSRSAYLLAWDWYLSSMETHRPSRMRLEHLDEATKAFWTTTRKVVAQEGTELLAAYVDSVLHRVGLGFSNSERHDFDPFDFLANDPVDHAVAMELSRRSLSVEDARRRVTDLAELDAWKQQASALVDEVLVLVPGSSAEVLKQRDEWLDAGERWLVRQVLEEVLFSAASYALFLQKPQSLGEIIDHHQPPDSTTHWVGWDPFPRSVEAILRRYVLRLGRDFGFDFAEGHHGNEQYDHELAVILVARALAAEHLAELPPAAGQEGGALPDGTNPDATVPSFAVSLDGLSPTKASDVRWVVEQLEGALVRVRGKMSMLEAIGIDSERARVILDEWVPAYLQVLRTERDRYLDRILVTSPLSESRVSAFGEKVLGSVRSEDTLREFFIHFGGYSEHLDESPEGVSPFGINTLVDKGMFLEEWYVYYDLMEGEFARGIVRGEEDSILMALAESCSACDGSIEDCVGRLGDGGSPAILTSRLYRPGGPIDVGKVVPKYARPDEAATQAPGFAGWYILDSGTEVPVFEFWSLRETGTLVIDTANLGVWNQYDPRTAEEPRGELVGFMSVLIAEVADHPSLVEHLESQEPEWVVKRAEWLSEAEVMRTRVWLRLLETFRYTPPQGSPGFVIKNEDKGEEDDEDEDGGSEQPAV